MTRTELKQTAQNELVSAMQVAFNSVTDSEEDSPALVEEMNKQFERVEKLFGYVPGSWNRGV